MYVSPFTSLPSERGYDFDSLENFEDEEIAVRKVRLT